jgi:hypothetical protein
MGRHEARASSENPGVIDFSEVPSLSSKPPTPRPKPSLARPHSQHSLSLFRSYELSLSSRT